VRRRGSQYGAGLQAVQRRFVEDREQRRQPGELVADAALQGRRAVALAERAELDPEAARRLREGLRRSGPSAIGMRRTALRGDPVSRRGRRQSCVGTGGSVATFHESPGRSRLQGMVIALAGGRAGIGSRTSASVAATPTRDAVTTASRDAT
jgi:hypothetical protein